VDEIESKRPLNLQTYNVIVTVLENFKKYSDYINILLSQNLDYLTYTCYQKAFNRIYRQKKVTPLRYYYANLLMANMFALEVGWVKSGMKESPDELARMYSKILSIQSKI
ncbi:MAG: TetR family transcriptional regulator C-terminal domain-containing protein, partial [Clostridia bacterium]|nr:TetR family transcriptional regulator C-terminal domain-containing protein [Clostridia bacterium]